MCEQECLSEYAASDVVTLVLQLIGTRNWDPATPKHGLFLQLSTHLYAGKGWLRCRKREKSKMICQGGVRCRRAAGQGGVMRNVPMQVK